MHWGTRKESGSSPTRSEKKAGQVSAIKDDAETRMRILEHHYVDIAKNGHDAEVIRKQYGKSLDLSPTAFALLHGKTKQQVVNDTLMEIGMEYHKHSKRFDKAEKAMKNMGHDGLDELDEHLSHHGMKGMKWGVRKARSSHPVSEDHANAEAHSQKVKEGGVKALSNKELQDVITRKNLEKQHRELVGGGNKFDKGHKTIKKILSVTKTLNDVHNTYETTAKVVKAVGRAAR